MGDRAVFYICSDGDGRRWIREAQHSVSSVREELSGIPAFLFLVGEPEDIDEFDAIFELPPQQGPFWYVDSTRYFVQATEQLAELGFERLLYLDVDTYVAWPCENLFDVLDKYDFAVGQSPMRDCCTSVLDVPESFCTLENGVTVFRSSGLVRQFLRDEWLARFEANAEEYGENDCAPLRDALWENNLGLRWTALAPEWCLRFDFGCWVQGRVRILHGRRGGISTDRVPLDHVARELNKWYGMRVWYRDALRAHLSEPGGLPDDEDL